jgi:hypothetical protein
MEARHLELELQLADLKGVTIHRWPLRYHISPPLWDLSHTHNLIHAGYEQGKEYLAGERQAEADASLQQPRTLTMSERWQAWMEQARALFFDHHPGSR